ncbi:MAG TPA: flagellar filament capping protein FliD, partial [Verrucomicrobiae bacterium]
GTAMQLDSLGIQSNGTDNTLTLSDSSKLDAALSSNLNAVKSLFTSQTGIAATLSTYLNDTVGDSGTLVTKQNTLSKEISDIDTQVANLEKQVLANQNRMTQEFLAMEQAQSKSNQQLQFLQQHFGGTQ